jgi:hypothetical protein
MVNQLLPWAAENSRLEKFVADNPLASKTVQRFVAGAGLSDAVSAAVDLNTRGIAGILDLLGEGVQDLACSGPRSSRMVNRQLSRSIRGVGPACRTGKSAVRC